MRTERSSTQPIKVDVSACVVLLVDDEPNLLHSLTRDLRKQPYHINTAHSAEEAMGTLKAHRVNLIVADENRPFLHKGTLMLCTALTY